MGLRSENVIPSFVEAYHKMFGMTERGLRNKTRIAEGLDNKVFDKKTVKLLKLGKITQNNLLKKLRQIEKRQIIKKELRNSFPSSNEKLQKVLHQEQNEKTAVKDNKCYNSTREIQKESSLPHINEPKVQDTQYRISNNNTLNYLPIKSIKKNLNRKITKKIVKKFCKDCPDFEKIICPHCKKPNFLCLATQIPVVKEFDDEACFGFDI